MDPADLERIVDEALRELPSPRAPRTLLPRVLLAVDTVAPQPWYEREWFTWPAQWQAASIALLIGIAATLTIVGPYVSTAFEFLMAGLRSSSPTLAFVLERAEIGAGLAQVLWRTVVQPIFFVGFVFAIVVLLAGGLSWAAINRLSFPTEGSTHS